MRGSMHAWKHGAMLAGMNQCGHAGMHARGHPCGQAPDSKGIKDYSDIFPKHSLGDFSSPGSERPVAFLESL